METCYRHPSRETGVSCSNCDRPICTDCMTSTSVGMRCPECARQRTKVKSMATVEVPVLTYILIGINVAVALGAVMSGSSVGGGGGLGSSLLSDGAVSRPTVEDGEWYRILTAGFLHAGLAHLAFNMFGLWVLGTLLEPAIGRVRFAVIYFVSLLAGSFGALLLEPTVPTVGASGAIFGLMGAAIVVMRHRGIDLMETGLPIWLGLNLIITFAVSNISIGGHIGGLVGGALAGLVMFELPDRVRMPQLGSTLLAAALGAASIVGSIVVSASAG